MFFFRLKTFAEITSLCLQASPNGFRDTGAMESKDKLPFSEFGRLHGPDSSHRVLIAG